MEPIVPVVAVVSLVVVVGGFAAALAYLLRQRRMYAPPPADLRRAGDEPQDYSVYEHGHDIATSYVERGGSGL